MSLREPPRGRKSGRTLEAGERLEADRLAADQGDDRLEDRLYRVGLGDQLREVLALLVGDDEHVLGVVAARTPAAGVLGPGQRAVGELEQRARVARVLGVAGDAGGAVQRAAQRHRGLHGGAGGFGEGQGAGAVRVGDHEPELVAAQAGHLGDAAHGRAQARRRAEQQLIAERVSA
jgi:hypothetical protein